MPNPGENYSGFKPPLFWEEKGGKQDVVDIDYKLALGENR